jgi:hypothetical protein
MALTKLPKNAFGTGSVDASKIEDGTIQNVELTDATLTSEKFATGTIANASLSNSTITINGTSISLGGSSSVGVDVNWQSVITADGSTTTTGVAGNGYFIDTTSAAHTFNLPASASLGDQIAIKDYAGTFSSNNLTIGRNGHNIQGTANDSLISTNRASLLLVYVDSTKGWIYAEESNVGNLEGPRFITATGGTITTSGDFKIHTFTGDDCFSVTLTGGCRPIDGPSNVDYLVIAGGGAGAHGSGGAGGGGAGGFRTSYPTCGGAVPVSITSYPVTVGGGGSIPSPCGIVGTSGSNSVFSTITSTGGGGGGAEGTPGGVSGGSGGGGGGGLDPSPGKSGGSGNTPPVSPPQGNGGGTGSGFPSCGVSGGGGGGGASTSGGNSSGPEGGSGGNGTANSITGSPVTRAGGGGGGININSPGSGGPAGPGGGGTGGKRGTTDGTPGTANTGGGGGGGGASGNPSGAGGKGIVIIRYKFQ